MQNLLQRNDAGGHMNRITFSEARVRKTYAGYPRSVYFMLGGYFCAGMAYQNTKERMVTEVDKLERFADAGIHVPRVLEIGPNWIEMERLPMRTLRNILEDRDLPTIEKQRALAQAARTLRDSHDAGLLHEDATPGNFGLVGNTMYTFDLEHRLRDRSNARATDYGRLLAYAVHRMPEGGVTDGMVRTMAEGYRTDLTGQVVFQPQVFMECPINPAKRRDFVRLQELRNEARRL